MNAIFRAIAWCRISFSDSIHVSQLRMTWHISAATSKTRMMSNSTTVLLSAVTAWGNGPRMQFQYNVLHHHWMPNSSTKVAINSVLGKKTGAAYLLHSSQTFLKIKICAWTTCLACLALRREETCMWSSWADLAIIPWKKPSQSHGKAKQWCVLEDPNKKCFRIVCRWQKKAFVFVCVCGCIL